MRSVRPAFSMKMWQGSPSARRWQQHSPELIPSTPRLWTPMRCALRPLLLLANLSLCKLPAMAARRWQQRRHQLLPCNGKLTFALWFAKSRT